MSINLNINKKIILKKKYIKNINKKYFFKRKNQALLDMPNPFH
jgi:hypothetical protein